MRWISHISGILLLLLPIYCIAQGRGYPETYASECREALSFWTAHKSEFKIAAERAGVPASFLFAIVVSISAKRRLIVSITMPLTLRIRSQKFLLWAIL